MGTIALKIKEVAKSYLNKREKPANSGFIDQEFEKRMKAVGWHLGDAWCAFFAELVYKDAYAAINPLILPELEKLFNASATATYKNFDLAPSWAKSKVPVEGALVIWRHGTGWQGHVGIVDQVNADGSFYSIEGNTDSEGGREGVEVARKLRKVNKTLSPTGLNVVGFIVPK